MSTEARTEAPDIEARRTLVRERLAAGNCRRCGLAAINVVHETDRENAPEGLDYYATVPFCEFEPDGKPVEASYLSRPGTPDYQRGYQAGYRAGRRHCDD